MSEVVWIPAFAGMTGLESGNNGVGNRNWRGPKAEMMGEIGIGGAAIVRFQRWEKARVRVARASAALRAGRPRSH